MGGRTKPNWAVFVGGPMEGQRQLLSPGQGEGKIVLYTPSASPGMCVPHEYVVTNERRAGGHHEASARVARFVRTLPEEPASPSEYEIQQVMTAWVRPRE